MSHFVFMTPEEKRNNIRKFNLDSVNHNMTELERAIQNKHDAFKRGIMEEVERQERIIKFLYHNDKIYKEEVSKRKNDES